VSLCPPQIPTWNDIRCKRPQKITWTMAPLIHVLCKCVCRKVRWDITESHLMLGAAPTNVEQPPRIFSPPSCNKPKSQAPLSSPHWIFAPCLAIWHKAQLTYSPQHKMALPSADESV
jgi:hypothetical protein